MKKMIASALAAVMTVSLASVAFADTTENFVLGYKKDATGAGSTVYVKDDDDKYVATTLEAEKILEAGEKVYIPVMLWNDANTNNSVESGELTSPDKDDVRGYKAQSDWKVGDADTSLEYVKTEDGYIYAIVVEIPETSTAKEFDLAGTLSVAKSKSAADKAIDQNKFDFDTSYASTTSIEDEFDGGSLPDGGAIVKFADDAGEIDIEFGDNLAMFTVNANGQGKLNLKYNTDYNKEFAAKYDYANIDFLNFEGKPSFNRNGTLYIYADEDSYLYEVTADGAKEIDAKYDKDEEAWMLTTRTLGSYAISDVELDTVTDTEDKEDSSSNSSSNNSGSTGNTKPNPDTGR